MWRVESSKKGAVTLYRKIRKKRVFQKVKSRVKSKCGVKSENKLSQEEKVAEVVRFLSRQLIPPFFSSFKECCYLTHTTIRRIIGPLVDITDIIDINRVS